MVGDLVSLHVSDTGHTLADLSKMLKVNEVEVAKTFDIDLPGGRRAAHLRIIR